MSMFTLVISCLTTSNLPCFMDLTFQVPMKLFFTASDFTCTTRRILSWGCFHFGSASSFLLELLFCSSPVGYWTPTDLGVHLSVTYHFAFHAVISFSRQECWSGLPFPSPVHHVMSGLSTMTLPSWVALHDLAHSFICICNFGWTPS